MRVVRTLPLTVVALALTVGACGPDTAQAQGLQACYLQGATLDEAAQRPSPLGATTFTLGSGEATLCYGRPSARGRAIMGALVPYGTPWRMGANEATAIHLPFPAQVGDVQVGPGNYSLYAIPNEGTWTIVVNGSANRWGIPINDDVKASDVGSFKRPVSHVDDMVEQLTWSWESDGPGAGRLVMEWEHTRLEIPIHSGGK